MSDRGILFVFSVLMVLGGLGMAAWLFATGQAGTVDGLFMLLTALLVAAVFGLYLRFMIRRAMEQVAKPAAQPVKTGATAAAGKQAVAPVPQA
jgi:predicted lipid-binding transport protein (Tim44 family)